MIPAPGPDTLSEQIDLETYSAELIQIFDRVILNDARDPRLKAEN